MIHVLLYDVMPHIYMTYYGTKAFFKTDVITQAIEAQFIQMSKALLNRKLNAPLNNLEGEILPIFCYDSTPTRKKALYPGYKEPVNKKDDDRNKIPFNIKNILIATVKNTEGFHVKCDGEEADDVIATMKKIIDDKLTGKEYRIYVLSRDNDLLQLTDSHTVCVDIGKDWGNFKDENYLLEKFGLNNFKKIILHKICFGDTSDNIKGVLKPRTLKKPVIEKINECHNLKDFVLNSGYVEKEKIPEVKRLFELIKLKNDLDCEMFCNHEKLNNMESLKT